MNDYLSKPVQLKELEAALERFQRFARVGGGGARGCRAASEPIDRNVLTNLRKDLGSNGDDAVAELVAAFQKEAPALMAALGVPSRRTALPI